MALTIAIVYYSKLSCDFTYSINTWYYIL